MTRKLGMDPEHVLALSSRLTAQVGRLDVVAAQVDEVAWASLNPVSYAIQPGGLVIAPWAIVGTQVAAARVRQAADDAAVLASSLVFQVLQQQAASAAAGSSPFSVPSVRGMLVDAVLRDPRLLGAMTAGQVAAWWASLSEAERSRLIEKHPLLIGNTEGVAYADRDRANRLALDAMLADKSIGGGQRGALEAIRDAIDEAKKRGEPVQLMILDFPKGADPRAAIAYGDLDTASSIGILVPGMNNTVEKSMVSLGTAAYNLYREQSILLAKAGSGESPAVVAWMGYQTPGAFPDPAVLREERAQVGAGYLAGTLGGLCSTLGPNPHLTVFAHSYGTRVATYALSEGASADSLVMFGSPGIAEGVNSVTDLRVEPGEVFATRADADRIAGLGLIGSGNLDPTGPRFGATPFSSEGSSGHDGVDDHGMLLAEDSNGKQQGYMDSGTDSLRDMALIGLGRGGQAE